MASKGPVGDWADHKQVMVDIETLGTRPGAPIVTLGAVRFLPRSSAGGDPGTDTFSARLDIEDAVAYGLTMDAPTVKWWLRQSREAQQALTGPATHDRLGALLADFEAWYNLEPLPIWGNGPSFDLAILSEAYCRAGLSVPWKFTAERCFRTAQALGAQLGITRKWNVAHTALADARDQAVFVSRVLVRLSEIAPR